VALARTERAANQKNSRSRGHNHFLFSLLRIPGTLSLGYVRGLSAACRLALVCGEYDESAPSEQPWWKSWRYYSRIVCSRHGVHPSSAIPGWHEPASPRPNFSAKSCGLGPARSRSSKRWGSANSLYEAWKRTALKAGLAYKKNAFRNKAHSYRLAEAKDMNTVAC
jgi:hypothetical protein